MDKQQTSLASIQKLFRYYKKLGERAMAQVSDEELHTEPAEDANSIAIIVKHLSGNMLSRWTDFTRSDGEKEWRQRDDEFIDNISNRKQLLTIWDRGWDCLFHAIDQLRPEELDRIIYIRNEGHTVVEAMHRQLTHYAYHVGQIVILAKIFRGRGWESLTIPKGASATFNKKKFQQEQRRKYFLDPEK